jgi:enamine deaminase RidA (YjgF/YER057c/UK114 family)
MSIRRIDVGPRMSQAVVHGKTVYLAGQVAADPKADVTGQTEQILSQIDGLLREAGTCACQTPYSQKRQALWPSCRRAAGGERGRVSNVRQGEVI